MKIAPIAAVIARDGDQLRHTLVHTGQHYDSSMSQVFLDQLGVGEPNYHLGVGSGSATIQMARTMERLEPVLADEAPDIVLVPGDVTSSLAAALVAVKMGIRIGHVEAGLRSFDRSMPEEINRVITDSISDMLFTHSPEARHHLRAEGRPDAAIHEVGNTMIDTLVAMGPTIACAETANRLELPERGYLVVTLHRPALTDGPALVTTARRLEELAEFMPIVFPMHPRTRDRMRTRGVTLDHPSLQVLEPMGYVEFLSLVATAAGVVTDSGGIQEETTYLGIPCFTLRDNTERPITLTQGTNTLLGLAPDRIVDVPALLRNRAATTHQMPLGWDGRASERILEIVRG
jgi:UDP-N-acetylglucosamine 2-epimerase (non-hydrolysing)